MTLVTTSVIIAGARTPIGKLLGSLKDYSAAQLGGIAIKGALAKAGLDPIHVDYVVMGHVIQAGCGQNPARQAAVHGGISMHVPALTINKVCLSGLNSIALADQLIRAGEASVVVAGGMESMTNAPHIVIGARGETKYGTIHFTGSDGVDSIPQDALSCAFEHMGMGDATEAHNATYRLTREDQDHIAVQSHQRAAAAIESGTFVDEIVAVGDFAVDEGVRPTTTNESLAKLRPAFATEGTITAGNASQISDGAAAVVVMSKARAQSLGLTWIAEIVSHGNVAGPDASLHQQPANAIEAAALKADIEIEDIKLFEINEAFAAIAVVSMRQLGVDESKVNVNGGAIALGHPVGMSGARLVLHLAHELGRRGGGLGAAALCGGGGQGDALIIRVSGA